MVLGADGADGLGRRERGRRLGSVDRRVGHGSFDGAKAGEQDQSRRRHAHERPDGPAARGAQLPRRERRCSSTTTMSPGSRRRGDGSCDVRLRRLDRVVQGRRVLTPEGVCGGRGLIVVVRGCRPRRGTDRDELVAGPEPVDGQAHDVLLARRLPAEIFATSIARFHGFADLSSRPTVLPSPWRSSIPI
jgi:hypothetical protein